LSNSPFFLLSCITWIIFIVHRLFTS
jgi:hypothetical protein